MERLTINVNKSVGGSQYRWDDRDKPVNAVRDKLGTLEDICEDILNWTDGRIENTDTIIITFKSSEKLLKLLEELE